MRLGLRQNARQFFKANPVRARIGPCIICILDPAIRNIVCNNAGNIADTVIMLGRTHIERFIEDLFTRCFHCRIKRTRDIANMHNRSPRCTVGFKVDKPLGNCPSNQIVQHNVETQEWRNAVGSRRSQIYRAKAGICQCSYLLLGPDFGASVSSDGLKLSSFIN
ncbi:hypothetical protein FQZ97_1012950 [compost metagenome]